MNLFVDHWYSTAVLAPCKARLTTSTCTLRRRCKHPTGLVSICPQPTKHAHSPYAINRYLNESKRLYGVLDKRLQGREYILDTYGIADIKIFGWARIAPRTGFSLDEFPNVKAWVERIEARPAVKAGIATSTPPPKQD